MFAVVKTGGKQYRVSPGDVIVVEKLLGDSGDNITLTNVLMVGDDTQTTIGTPFVEGSTVDATIREQDRADKIIVFKKKRRQGYRRKKGHRQDITVLTINTINANGSVPVAKPIKAIKPASAGLTEMISTDINVEAIPVIEKVAKKSAVRKPKIDANVIASETAAQSQEIIKVAKPKKVSTKPKKEPEA